MALYKILTTCGKSTKTHTFSGVISGEISISKNVEISGTIEDSISGVISGYIYGVNYIANNYQYYSGVASGIISGTIKDTISGTISGNSTISGVKTISGTISDNYSINIQGYSFLRDEDDEEIDWYTISVVTLKEKLASLYRIYPQFMFIPVHIMREELDIELDTCTGV
jgi:hypothetical protein